MASALTFPARCACLLSYWMFRKKDITQELQAFTGAPSLHLFADSGAFSAAMTGAPVKLDAYLDWLAQYRQHFVAYANLDVIDDPMATWANQHAMEARGFMPIPVFHVGEDFAWLTRYLDAGYPYIALGGLVPHMHKSELMPWLVKCFRLAEGRAVLHGFGVNTWKLLARLPWYSVDATSWTQANRFGRACLFNPERGEWRPNLYLSQRILKTEKASMSWQYMPLLHQYGFSMESIFSYDGKPRKEWPRITISSFMAGSEWVRLLHGPVALADALPGLHFYFSVQSFRDMHLIRDTLAWQLSRTSTR